jgi:hypothetical protein
MLRALSFLAVLSGCLLLLCGCGQAESPGPQSATQQPHPREIDVCALLSDADIQAVGAAVRLAVSENAIYQVQREEVIYPETAVVRPLGACRFNVSSETSERGRFASGSLVVVAHPASYFDGPRSRGTPIADTGDEAVTDMGTVYVRAGAITLTTVQNSFDTPFMVELYRRMTANIVR